MKTSVTEYFNGTVCFVLYQTTVGAPLIRNEEKQKKQIRQNSHKS